MMGNSMPTEESGAPRVPEQSGAPMMPEESGAPNVPEQSGTPMVPEESGTTSVPEGAVATVQDVGTASVPEGAGVAVGQERSESEADSVLGNSPSYADHVQGPGTPPSIPSLEPERFSPSPKEAAHPAEGFASGSIQPETADDEARGKWTAPDVPSAPAAQPAGLEDREPKRPRKGLPAGVRVELSPVPVPGEAEDRLLRELFRQEQERRIEEAMALGIHLRPGENEPRPLLSHYFGRPAAVEDMYDSLSQALTNRDRSFWTRVSLGQGASSRYLPGGSSSVYGLNRLERPEEMMAPTPFHPKLPAYPEPEPRPQLMVDASTITDNAADQWSEWLRSARQGRSRNTGRNTRSSMRTAPDVGGAGSAKSGHRSGHVKFTTVAGVKMSVKWLSERQPAAGKMWGVGCQICAYAATTAKSTTCRRRTSKSSTAWGRFEVNSVNSLSCWSIKQHVMQSCHKRAIHKWFACDRPEAQA
ncbi:unnamed protein product, partial [Symbiodinium microadriaticum]